MKRGAWTHLGDMLSAALDAYARIVETPKGNMDQLIDEAFAFIKPNLKPSTVKQYGRAVAVLKRKLQQFQPHQVKQVHAAGIKRSMAGTPNMCNRVLSVARQVFDYALEQQWPGLESNPFTGVRRHSERKRGRLIGLDEYVAIYAKAGERLQVIMDLLIRTGQRVTAVLRIRRSDLTDEGIRFGKHKTDSKSIVKWTPELEAIRDRALAMHGKLERLTLLFNRKNKAPDYRSVKDQWDAACKAAGVEDAHIHDLRAVAGTWAKKLGLNPQALLGHVSPQNTARYLRDKEEPVVEGPSFCQAISRAKNKH
ncbi:MAG: tyrosine-type recombinase/integrase [Gammaproteobacteria bacterium]